MVKLKHYLTSLTDKEHQQCRRRRRQVAFLLSWFTAVYLFPRINLAKTNLICHPHDLLATIFIFIGILAFYSGFFKFLDWYNNK